MTSKCIFFGVSSVYKKNEQYFDPSVPLLIVWLIVIVFGITIVIPNILAVILALNIGLGFTLLLAFMEISLSLPLTACLFVFCAALFLPTL